MRLCPNDQSINYPIVCKNSDIFIRLEEKLLLEYPKLKDKNIFYTVNTNIINKTAILKQNEIEKGDTITINYDNEEEEKVFAIQLVSGDQNIHYPIACKESDIIYHHRRFRFFMSLGNRRDVPAGKARAQGLVPRESGSPRLLRIHKKEER